MMHGPNHIRDVIPAQAGIHARRLKLAQGSGLVPDMDSGLRRNDPVNC